MCRRKDLQNAVDKNGNTPLQYLNARTPLSAVKALEPLGEDESEIQSVSLACISFN